MLQRPFRFIGEMASTVQAKWQQRLYSETARYLYRRDRLVYSGDTHRAEIALTFDDGPHPDSTPALLDILQRYGIGATFFCLGRGVVAHRQIARRVHDAGHAIANHGWTHADFATISGRAIRAELTRTSKAIGDIIGSAPTLFRPPFGTLNWQILRRAHRAGLATIMWSADLRDWSDANPYTIVDRADHLACSGAIFLLHDNPATAPRTTIALPRIIEGLQGRGFKFVTIPGMLAKKTPMD